MQRKNFTLWIVWLLVSAGIALYLVSRLFSEEADKTVFLPGTTSAGHYQIELACGACHTGPYADREAIQEACESCHLDGLKAAKDDHPKSKFTDPRNADRIAVLDARYCVTCHVEHRPEITSAMGVTIPRDTCYLCHNKIAEDRPSHAGMAFDTCVNAGCHNFHDNTALYEDFLVKHMDEAETTFGEQLLQSNLRAIAEQLPDYPLGQFPLEPLTLAGVDIPAGVDDDGQAAAEWLASSHAAAGVGCAACHAGEADTGSWVERPGHRVCASCHSGETAGFLQGRHGMRLDVDKLGVALEPMRPALARLPMKAAAADTELGCQSCHAAHRYDSANAAVDSCLGCHDDRHSLAYEGSPHHLLWQREQAGELAPGSGVTCAGCHMPRVAKDYYWGTFFHNEVQHNQSDNLRPNEKMIRPVCMNCHGLGFAINALADPALIDNNFATKPAVNVRSIELARERHNEPAPAPGAQ